MGPSTWNKDFVRALSKHPDVRTNEDNRLIFSFLRNLEPLISLKEEPLRVLCRNVCYERHLARETLFKKGQPNTCWFILLSGSVFIDGIMYLPHAGFGKRSGSRHIRPCDCYVLEDSEMIVVHYPQPGSEGQQGAVSATPETSRRLGRNGSRKLPNDRQMSCPPQPFSAFCSNNSSLIQQQHEPGQQLHGRELLTSSLSAGTSTSLSTQHGFQHHQNPHSYAPVTMTKISDAHQLSSTSLLSSASYCQYRNGGTSGYMSNPVGSITYSQAYDTGAAGRYRRRSPEITRRPEPPALAPDYPQSSDVAEGPHGTLIRRPSQNSNASSVGTSASRSSNTSQVTIEDTDHVLGAYGGGAGPVMPMASQFAYQRLSSLNHQLPAPMGYRTGENLREVETMVRRSEVYLRESPGTSSSHEQPSPADDKRLNVEGLRPGGRSLSTASSLSTHSHDSGISASNNGQGAGGLQSGRCPSWASGADYNEEMDLNGLPENIVDSEDEDDESCPSGDSLMDLRDTVRDCLERDPVERNEDDIQILLDFLQHMPSFANLPQCVKRELCSKMVFAVVDRQGTVVMKDEEPMDSWCVIVNGEVEVQMPDGARKEFRLGDSFGIDSRPEQQLHRGTMQTMCDDCQFVLVAQPDFVEIMGKLRENVRKHENSAGEVVSETERRSFPNGAGEGYVLIKARPEKLVQALVEERDQVVDPYFVEDFLLMYRTFIDEPCEIFSKLMQWFADSALRDKVARLVLLWVNNHFNDFETNQAMMKLLEDFEMALQQENMPHHQQLLNIACSVKSRSRTVIYTRSNRDEILHFSILGGYEKGYGIFISKVESNSQAEKLGLKRGDQILEVNGTNFLHIPHQKALELLRNSTHLSLTLKSNLLGFKEMLAMPDRPDIVASGNAKGGGLMENIRKNSGGVFALIPNSILPSSNSNTCNNNQPPSMFSASAVPANVLYQHQQQQRSSLPTTPATRPVNQVHSSSDLHNQAAANSESSSPTISPATQDRAGKIKNLFKKWTPSLHSSELPYDGGKDQVDCHGRSQDVALDPDPGARSFYEPHRKLRPSRSNPDICMGSTGLLAVGPAGGGGVPWGISKYYQPVQSQSPEHVLKIYRADQSFKYLTVYKETTAQNVVQLALQEFGMSGEPSLHYSLCEVSVSAGGLIKHSRLPDQIQNLAERIALNSRYYLKNLKSTESLVPDELAAEILKDATTTLLQLSANILAAQLTLQDFAVFAAIEQTEYVDNLFKLPSKYGWPKLEEFEQLVNRETYWVATEIVNEKNISKRVKIVKKFIQVAKHCKEFKNFNSMFAVLSGLDKPSVARLHSTWDKVPNKYKRMHEDLKLIIDPSRNMSKYRQLLLAVSSDPPCVPLFPILKKDLTFFHEGNKTWVDGMVNFEKLRMVAKEVRGASKLASQPYELHSMFEQARAGRLNDALLHMNSFDGGVSVATMRKNINTRPPHMSRRKLYEQALMVRRVKSYLANLFVVDNENNLDKMSLDCEPQVMSGSSGNVNSRQRSTGALRQPSPSPSSNSSLSNESRRFMGPKFGAESPQAVQKLMSLAETVRQHRPPKSQMSVPAPSFSNPHGSTGSPSGSPTAPRRTQHNSRNVGVSASGLFHHQTDGLKGHGRSQSDSLQPVDLTAESSSVTPVGLQLPVQRMPSSGSMSDSTSCSGHSLMVHAPSCDSTDSGHVSLDAYSTCSQCSPPSQRRSYPSQPKPSQLQPTSSNVNNRPRPTIPTCGYSSVQVGGAMVGHTAALAGQCSDTRRTKSAAPQPPTDSRNFGGVAYRKTPSVPVDVSDRLDEEEQVSRV